MPKLFDQEEVARLHKQEQFELGLCRAAFPTAEWFYSGKQGEGKVKSGRSLLKIQVEFIECDPRRAGIWRVGVFVQGHSHYLARGESNDLADGLSYAKLRLKSLAEDLLLLAGEE